MLRFSYRQLLTAAVALLVLGTCALVVGLAAGLLEVLAVAVFLALLGAATYVVLQVRRVRHLVVQLDRQLIEQLADLASTVRSNAEIERAEIEGTLREIIPAEHKRTRAAIEEAITNISHKLQARRDRVAGREFAEFEAFVDLRQLLAPRAPLPPTRGWAASPDVLRTLVELIFERRPELVVECGSGTSSIWLGYALERVGAGRLVSLEHDEGFAAVTSRQVSVHGLEKIVDVRLAPLESWTGSGGEWRWYSLEAVRDLRDVGLVFVDGPPGLTQEHARYPAVPILLGHCTPDAVFVLDDASRREEHEISDRWLADFPSLRLTRLDHEKGCDIFTRKPE